MKFCEVLRQLLEENDITQKKLANDLNIGVTTIGNYVRGFREPDFEVVKLIATYFNVSVDYLLDFRSGVTQSHSEDELLRVYRSLSEQDRQLYLEQGKLLIRHSIKLKQEQ